MTHLKSSHSSLCLLFHELYLSNRQWCERGKRNAYRFSICHDATSDFSQVIFELWYGFHFNIHYHFTPNLCLSYINVTKATWNGKESVKALRTNPTEGHKICCGADGMNKRSIVTLYEHRSWVSSAVVRVRGVCRRVKGYDFPADPWVINTLNPFIVIDFSSRSSQMTDDAIAVNTLQWKLLRGGECGDNWCTPPLGRMTFWLFCNAKWSRAVWFIDLIDSGINKRVWKIFFISGSLGKMHFLYLKFFSRFTFEFNNKIRNVGGSNRIVRVCLPPTLFLLLAGIAPFSGEEWLIL